ncbi:hypothetical protein AB0D78_28110 [Streptomyces avermitilis]|uniref:hypothetical protein n=1 Tax=Streptomyces avermitilis TaxID=33903 RepID=UPI0033F22E49
MALQWGTPSEPAFNPLANGVTVTARKDFGDDTSASMTFRIDIGVEGPEPSEETVLGWLDVLHLALKADGWTAALRISETAPSSRQVEEV